MKNIMTLLLSLSALFAFSLGSLFAPVYAQGTPAAHHDMAASGKACANCAATCEKTLAYFQKKGGKYAEAKNQDVLKDCITLCKASADLKGRKSAHAAKLDAVCNEVCKQCAEMCKEMKDPALKDCIQSCETCHDCCG
jgi:hypothetical protein